MIMLSVHVLVLFALWWKFFYRRYSRAASIFMLVAVAVKVLAGLAITSYYQTTYGGGDMHGYMVDASVCYELFQRSPLDFFKLIFLGDDSGEVVKTIMEKSKFWYDNGYRWAYNDSRTVIRFHAVLSLFSGLYLPVHLLWSNVLCMLGWWWMMITLLPPAKERHRIPMLCWLMVLMPDFIIWSSPVMKEPLLIFAMGASVRTLKMFTEKRSWLNGWFLVAGLSVFLFVKNFWMLLFLPGVIALVFFPVWGAKMKGMAVTYLLAGLLVMVAGSLIPSLHLPSLLYGQQLNMWRFAIYEQAGSLLEPVPFAPEWWSVIRHIPFSFFYGLLLPLPVFPVNVMALPFALENLSVFVLMLTAFVRLIRRNINPDGFSCMLVIAGVGIVVISAMTTPVLGSLIRFKLPGVLLLVMVAFSILYNKEQVPKAE